MDTSRATSAPTSRSTAPEVRPGDIPDSLAGPVVRPFHQILLWPLELMPAAPGDDGASPWTRLVEDAAGAVWREVDDEFPSDPELLQDRHYNEFVTFLPYVQRFLYGEGATRSAARARSPIQVLRRSDVKRARL